ncbi:hypothetical protein GMOD_00000095 [Pyrenophora seminiperda CCB06]|uniref:Uncharacterized protein n=1 Tax=Pyrenophora seminiperda CCB06 TaxID=1302712 RepID=A0A3M7M6M3_9PLEO|nr:hypothetical protein GMOD_00000095 [Pyrenophora seminiperda CCB06]
MLKLSQPMIILIASLLSTAVALTVVLALIHYLRRRPQRHAQTQQRRDIESSLARGRRSVLTIDTDLPRGHDLQRYTSTRTPVSEFPVVEINTNVPSMPMAVAPAGAKNPALPERVFGEMGERSGLEAGLVRSATRKSLASLPPGVGGRSLNRPARFEDVGLKEVVQSPTQVYDAETRRTIYLG